MHDPANCHELTCDELSNVIGSGGKAAPPKPSQLFEISDYSFDIEQVLNVGS